jgi:hypothetical protein
MIVVSDRCRAPAFATDAVLDAHALVRPRVDRRAG